MSTDPFDALFSDLEQAQATTADTRKADLVERLTRAKHTYYNTAQDDGGDPLDISDAEYDAMEDELRTLDPNHPFLAKVGAPVVSSGWEKVRHEAPMGSLNKAQEESDFRSWWNDCFPPGYTDSTGRGLVVWSDKCDGISLSQKYQGGKQDRALTRGDGEIGEDISRNVWLMKGRQPFLNGFEGHLRGEVVLRKTDWKTHLPEYSNPRNAASGISKRQSDASACAHLTVLHYQMIRDGKTIPFKEQEFKALASLGFSVPSWGVLSTFDEALAVYNAYIKGRRDALDYDIDGLVFEVNSQEHADQLGMKNHRPRGAIAFKFPHEQKATPAKNKRDQVGKSGRVTPVADFDTIRLAGVNVSKASLHNYSNVQRLLREAGITDRDHLCVGDVLLVSRRNDVIPYVEKILTPAPAGSKALLMPAHCPECKMPLTMQGEYLMCTNTLACPAQVAGLVQRWVEKIGLKGWGSTIIDALVGQEIIIEPADLYELDPNVLSEVELDGRKIGSTAHTVMNELLTKGVDLPLHVFVGSLGIPLCARSICKQIADAGYDTLAKMRAATWQEIAAIDRMGDTKAHAFVDGLLLRAEVIDNLLGVGVQIKPPSDGPMKGKSVCMTGFRDPSMTTAIEESGGTVKSGVGRDLTILVAKDPNSNSGKAKKAKDYGVEVIGPDEMWQRLGGRP